MDRLSLHDPDLHKGFTHPDFARGPHFSLNAKLTIVVASGDYANCGIDGLGEGTRSFDMPTAFCPDGSSVMSLLPELSKAAATTTWNTPGWTYQECLLSKRVLFFANRTIYF